jgi:acyl-CoA synthetase (NDP forming)
LSRLLPAHAATLNPIDTTAGGSVEVLASAAECLLRCDEVDSVMVVHTSLSKDDTVNLADALSRVVATRPAKPLLAVYVGKATTVSADVASFDFPEPAARALAAVARYAEWRATPPPTPPRMTGIDRRAASRLIDSYLDHHPDGGWLDTDEAAAVVATYGIALAPTQRADTAAEAVAAARRCGYPVVLKSAAGELLHRTDVGGVRLNLRSDNQVRQAFAAIRAALGTQCGVVVQPMMPSGVETAVGIASDPSVGPIVMLALGGVATDLLADRSFRLPPIGRQQVREQIRSLRGAPLLFGYRGAPVTDVRALEDLILRVGLLAEERPEVSDLDLNPVVVTPDGAVAVDVKLRLAPPSVVDPYLRRLARPQ